MVIDVTSRYHIVVICSYDGYESIHLSNKFFAKEGDGFFTGNTARDTMMDLCYSVQTKRFFPSLSWLIPIEIAHVAPQVRNDVFGDHLWL